MSQPLHFSAITQHLNTRLIIQWYSAPLALQDQILAASSKQESILHEVIALLISDYTPSDVVQILAL